VRAKTFVFAGVAVWMTTLALVTATAADDRGQGDDESRIQQGLAMAPGPLNMHGKNRALVGLGSYLVNGAGDCNGCHSGPSGEYAVGGNPFQREHKVINKAAYLSGGAPLFGPFFIPRNLTPDKTGRPEGGASYEEFHHTMRTGLDPDQAHPQFGPCLQVMPWPNFRR
jgi:hypothetical protein